MPETPDTDRSGRARHMKLLLILSLALNLLLISFVAGRALFPEPRLVGPHVALHHATEELSPQAQEIVRNTMKAHGKDLRAHVRELRREKARLQELLAADPLDEAAVAEALHEIHRHNGAIQEEIHKATLEIARQLSAEERQHLNLRWSEHLRKHRREMPGEHRPGPHQR